MKKTPNSRVKIEVFHGLNCIKSKVYGQLGVQLTHIERWRTKLNYGKKEEPDDVLSNYYSLSFFIITQKSYPGGYFLGVFNASYLHQI